MSDAKPPRTAENSVFSIVHIAPPQITAGGDFVYRLLQPDSALGRLPGVVSVSATNIISSRIQLCLAADVLIIQLLGDPDLLPVILERRRSGRPTVFEISDNFLDFQPSNPAAAFYENMENRACILQLISESDAVQTTVPALADMFAKYNSNNEVFENMIENPGGVEKPDGPLTVGWGGSAGHYEDIRAAAPALIAWLRRHPGVRLSIMADPKFKKLFAAAPAGSFLFRPPGSLSDYYDFVRSLHIGIAPLRNDPFNLCRSDVKFIEYASHGAAPVCSDAPTYARTVRNGETGMLFSDLEEMTLSLDALASDPELRLKIAKQANEYIRTERSEQAAASKRLDFYKSLLPVHNTPGGIDERYLTANPSLKRTPGANHFLHHLTNAEQRAYNALVFQFSHGDLKSAEKSCREAAEIEPEYFHAHFILGGLALGKDAATAETALRRAANIFSASCETRILLSQALAALSRNAEAVEIIRSVQSDCPLFAPAYLAEYEMSATAGEGEKNAGLLEKALEANPHYATAAMRLGAISLDSGDHARAEELFRRAADIMPRLAPAQYGRASALNALGREEEAVDCFAAALSLAPDSAPILDSLLSIPLKYYKAGDNKKAIVFLARALEAAPDRAELLFWMVRIQERVNGEQAALPFRLRLASSDRAGKYKRYYEDNKQ
ncbi:MAG: tetratricopeptide repeat protein [bacterium]